MREIDRQTWLKLDPLSEDEQRVLDGMVERDLGRRLEGLWRMTVESEDGTRDAHLQATEVPRLKR